ncbi:hypothetical protein AAE478_005251 [Parahypoxylon ruwenzoriense]
MRNLDSYKDHDGWMVTTPQGHVDRDSKQANLVLQFSKVKTQARHTSNNNIRDARDDEEHRPDAKNITPRSPASPFCFDELRV